MCILVASRGTDCFTLSFFFLFFFPSFLRPPVQTTFLIFHLLHLQQVTDLLVTAELFPGSFFSNSGCWGFFFASSDSLSLSSFSLCVYWLCFLSPFLSCREKEGKGNWLSATSFRAQPQAISSLFTFALEIILYYSSIRIERWGIGTP